MNNEDLSQIKKDAQVEILEHILLITGDDPPHTLRQTLSDELKRLHDSASPASHTRPENCRNELQAQGKLYPKSGCAACGNGGLVGCPYEKR